MGGLLRLAAREVARRLARRSKAYRYFLLIPAASVAVMIFFLILAVVLIGVAISSADAGGCGTSLPVSAPVSTVRTAGQVVRYFESQGISANGAAGITGNLQQENGFSPVTNAGGVGAAQWDPGRGAAMQAWARQNNLDPATLAAQLAYIVYDLRTHYPALLVALNAAPDPGTAATLFQDAYEQCGTCVNANRVQYAVAALQAAGGGGASGTVPVVYSTGCTVGSVAGYVNPLSRVQRLTGLRVDMGVDYGGSGPVLAAGPGLILNVAAHGWPGLSFIEEQFSSGSYAGKCWYAAENIRPMVSAGDTVQAGQQIGVLLPGYPNSEFGWGTCSGGETLAASLHEQAAGDPGGWTSAVGASANRFLMSLGAPSGVLQSGGVHGPLPAGYP